MKNIYYLLLLMPFLAFLDSCDDKEEIVFEHELPQFEQKENAVLLEVIMPQGTKANDEIYIVGEFNGGEEAAVGQLEWRLEKAPGNDVKWGIYLNPSTFKDGKTLADGFYFVSGNQGAERTVKNESVLHQLEVTIGTRTNVTVSRWKAYFEEGTGEETHDGHVIYVEDNSTWAALALYGYWNDVPVWNTWPGLQVAGKKTIDGVTYKYFDTGEANEGLKVILIFNNNSGGKQFNGPTITLDRDYYFRMTDDEATEFDPNAPEPEEPEMPTHSIYVEDHTGWNSLFVYGYGDEGSTPAWPGLQMSGSKKIGEITFKYFGISDDIAGKWMNLIFNNNDGTQFNGPYIELNRDYYFTITYSDEAGTCTEINAPVEN